MVPTGAKRSWDFIPETGLNKRVQPRAPADILLQVSSIPPLAIAENKRRSNGEDNDTETGI